MLFRVVKNDLRVTFCAIAAAMPLLAIPQAASALNIALTNDDGWTGVGMQTLRDALVEAGHTVVLVGSSENQSGKSDAIDLAVNNLRVTKRVEDGNPNGGSDQYSVALVSGVGATPATTALLAISIAAQSGTPVDLLISGTNAGANIGAWTNVSGTVGAAMNALSYLKGYSIPAIAISTDERFTSATCPAGQTAFCESANTEHFKKVAIWMVKFVATLQQKPGALKREGGLLPENIGLNINYPTHVISGYDETNKPIYKYVEEIQGVALAAQGRLAYAGGIPKAYPVGCYRDCVRGAVGVALPAGITANPEVKDVPERPFADTVAFSKGNVTVVPFTIDMTADTFSAMKFLKLVHDLNKE